MRYPTALALATGLFLLPSLALAHITFVKSKATTGASFKAVLAVPHGCGGKATEALGVRLPEGFIAAKPMPKPGWRIDIVQGPYAKAYKHFGENVTSGPVEIRWTGGPLEDAWYDEFTILGTFAESGTGPSRTAAFPVTQICADGARVDWTDVGLLPDGSEPAHPAPTIEVLTAQDGNGDDAHMSMSMAGHGDPSSSAPGGGAASAAASDPAAIKAGDLRITGAFIRATPPGARTGGGYLTITNTGTAPDRLTGSSSPLAGSVVLHAMTLDGGVMRMRPLSDGLDIPAGATVSLKPGGDHLMFETIARPFREGDSIALSLEFSRAGRVDLRVPVGPIAAGAATLP